MDTDEPVCLVVLGKIPDLDPLVHTHLHPLVLLYEWVGDLLSSSRRDLSEEVGLFELDGAKPPRRPTYWVVHSVLPGPAALFLPEQVQGGRA